MLIHIVIFIFYKSTMRSFLAIILVIVFSMTLGCSSKEVTLVEVDKSARKMYLRKHNKIIKAYNIALGLNPVGRKVMMGDNKTPEGTYVLDFKNPSSKFFKSIHISYPNYIDVLRARSVRANPGNSIVIHGTPNGISEKAIIRKRGRDWTNGCIAIKNSDMDEIWSLVGINTPIRIKP